MDTKYYDIGGKQFYQERLCLGQRNWVFHQLKEIRFDPATVKTDYEFAIAILGALGERLAWVYAAILIPAHETRDDFVRRMKNNRQREEAVSFLECHLEETQESEIWLDFFCVNEISSLLDRWSPVADTCKGKTEPSTENRPR